LSRNTWTPTPEQLIQLRRNLTDHFNDDELRSLCSGLGIDYTRLRGPGKAAKASELVRMLAARGRLPELIVHASRLRPQVLWGDLAAETIPPYERRATSAAAGGASRWWAWLIAVLIVASGLVWALSGALRPGQPVISPGSTTESPSPVPATLAPTSPAPTPTEIAVTATPQWTPVPPTVTSTSPAMSATPEQTPTITPTPFVLAATSTPRSVMLLAPINGACVKSLTVTFKWSGAALWPGESFVVAVAPSQVNKSKCTSNYAEGIQTSPLLTGYEWTTNISAPSNGLAACAGSVEWKIYIRNAAGDAAEAAPAQYFQWNPLGCK
jgi:hypothetical protein